MDAVSEVKARLNIEDVIGEYVHLKRTGKNYKGLSPFTNEKTASFVVSPEKQIWHDFSSGRGGDIFTFVQEVEGLDFKSTLELLARKAGVELEKFQGKSSQSSDKERIYEALDQAAKFYQVQLGANKSALEYVTKIRQYTRQTILDFRIGYSPNAGDALVSYLSKKGFTVEELHRAGLTSGKSRRPSDMFRGRIMIPLCDQFGKVVGFTARILEDNPNAPKYINTPSTLLYDKSRHIYGLHLAKRSIQQEKFCVLVEGNLDVISSHQAGVSNVVATAGTALTEMQLKVLGRFSPDVRLAFDEDSAGLAATERAIPIADKTGVELSIITIPSGKDPDDLIKENPDSWKKVISNHEYAIDWLMKVYEKALDLSSATGKKRYIDKVLPVVKKLHNEVEIDHYVQKISKLLGVSYRSILNTLDSSKDDNVRPLKKPKTSIQNIDREQAEIIKTSDRILSLAFMLAAVRPYLKSLKRDMFVLENQMAVYVFLINNPKFDGSKQQLDSLHQISDYVKILTLQFDELYAGVELQELKYEAARLRTRMIEYYVKHQKKQILNEMNQAEESEMSKYLTKVRDLDKLLKNIEE